MAYTLDGFSRFCSELRLENGKPLELERFQQLMLEDHFAGVGVPQRNEVARQLNQKGATMKHRKTRPAYCEPGSLKDARELGERLRLSRERLAASELARLGSAWRLWAACADATFGYAREADRTYVVTLAAAAAGLDRKAAGRLLRRFDELGVFGWKAAPLGSHGISELSLPRLVGSGRPTHDPAGGPETSLHDPVGGPETPLQSNESLSSALITHDSVERAGSLGLERFEACQPQEAGKPTRTGSSRDETRAPVCPQHGTPMKLERLPNGLKFRCWDCLDESYGRRTAPT
jgi:hypothetical protein